MKILVVNCGSSSLKYQLIDIEAEHVLAKGLCSKIGIDGSVHSYSIGKAKDKYETHYPTHLEAVNDMLAILTDAQVGVIRTLDEIDAIGHRIAQGGDIFRRPTLVNDEVIEKIEDLAELAPLHNKAHAIGIRACKTLLPNTPMVVVFDTSFHQTLPDYAYMYALPYYMYEESKIRKYGFHGTSHHYVSIKAAEMLNKKPNEFNGIVCHLGNGSSITAVKGGKSIDTTMGFTPLDGLIMGSRAGSCDLAIIPYIMEKYAIKPKEMSSFLNKQCGFLGVSGVSSDFRDIVEAAETNEKAKLALDMFVYQIKKHIGAYTAILGRVDALVFTAGIGENSAKLRELVTDDFAHFGIAIDNAKNDETIGKDADISSKDAKVKVLVVPTNEELMIAKETFNLVK